MRNKFNLTKVIYMFRFNNIYTGWWISMDFFYPFKILNNFMSRRQRQMALNTIYGLKPAIKTKPIPQNVAQAKKIRISDL